MKRNESYVSAAEPTAPAPATRPAPTVELVSGKVLDNLWGGVGVAVALSAGYALVRILLANLGMMPLPSLVDVAWAVVAFALVGALAFGMLTAWRASLDERERQGELDTLRDNEAAMLADIDEMAQEIAELKTKLAYAQRDLQERIVLQQQMQAKAQRTYTPSAQVAENEIPFAVYDKARQLVERACRNLPASKDKVCAILGWTQGEWREAHQLAQDAGLFRVVGNRTELLVDDLDTALAIMDVYAGFSQ